MPRGSVRLCFSAINGTGLGHLRRALCVAREARRLLEALDLRPEIRIVTTSDAPQIACGEFPVYKLPSKSTARALGVEPRAFTAEARMVLSGLVASFRPHVLVQDTRPEGVYQEFAFVRDHARAAAFIGRHADPSHTARAAYRAHLALYDLIVVPDDPDQAHRYPMVEALVERRALVGHVHGVRRCDALSRAEVCRRMGLPEQAWVVYVSAGGGGDPRAEADLSVLVDTLLEAHPDAHLLVGYGPLYRGVQRRGPRVHPLTEPEIAPLLAGVDAAFSAAGYNTHQELLAARVPAAFFAQTKGIDRQDLRVQRGVEAGLHLALPAITPEDTRVVAAQLRDVGTLERLTAALHARPVALGALNAAEALLALDARHPRSAIDRLALTRAVAARAQDLADGTPEALSPLTARAFDAWVEATEGAAGLGDMAVAIAADRAPWSTEGPRHIARARRLARLARDTGWPVERLQRFLQAYGRAPGGVALRSRRLDGLLGTLLDGPSALTLDEAVALLDAARKICRAVELADLLDALLDAPATPTELERLWAEGCRGQPMSTCLEHLQRLRADTSPTEPTP